MQHLVDGLRDAVRKECWYPALTLALAIPDACAAIERPGTRITGNRYSTWVDTYFGPHATVGGTTFLTGRELYALRCRFLHQGELWLNDQQPSDPDPGRAMFEVLNEFVLYVCEMAVTPQRSIKETATSRTTSYEVAVKDLCEWICQAAETWLPAARRNVALSNAIDKSGRIMRLSVDGTHTPI